ncbi:MAG: T9SS type A sorting domain-containing protein, partial [Bacteroidia bacterium]|nr:T9SS type A sorting domain-containing protein [Bacteroidia bacterium]
KNTSLATSTIVIDVRKLDLPKGVYFIEVDIKQQKTYKRFVVE